MDAETAFHFVGTLGRYQFALSILLCLGNFVFSLQMVLMVVVGANVTEINDYNNMTTIVTEFNLYDEAWIVELMQSLMMAGYMVGCIIFGQLSDSFGRRIPLLVGVFGGSVIGFCSAFATSWQTFAVTRFLTGVFVGGQGVTVFVLLTEILGKKVWAALGLTYQIFFSLGICFLALLGYLIPRWQTLCMVAGGIAFGIAILMLIFLPESPRWLYATGKTDKSQTVLRKIAERNGRDSRSIYLSPAASGNATTNSFIDVFRHKKLILWMAITFFLWFANGLIYYGLTLSAASLTSDLFLGIVLSGAIEIPATIVCIFLMDLKWFGRRATLWLLCAVSATANIISIFTYENADAKLILGLGSKLAIAGSFNVIYVYSGEVFPTSLRSIAIGTASTAARVGAIVAPFLTVRKTDGYAPNEYVPYLVFGVVSAVSFALLFLLPKTVGKPVPQTIEDVIGDESSYKHLVNENEVNANLISDGDVVNGNILA